MWNHICLCKEHQINSFSPVGSTQLIIIVFWTKPSKCFVLINFALFSYQHLLMLTSLCLCISRKLLYTLCEVTWWHNSSSETACFVKINTLLYSLIKIHVWHLSVRLRLINWYLLIDLVRFFKLAISVRKHIVCVYKSKLVFRSYLYLNRALLFIVSRPS